MLIAIYVSALVAANLLVFALGPWWSPVNALLLIGLDLTLRDRLHDRYGMSASLVVVFLASLASYVLNPAGATIALASALAFLASGAADAMVYQAARDRSPMLRINSSNAAGAAVDSLVFPTVAFGGLMPEIVALQFVAKFAGGAAYAWFLQRKASA